MDCRMWFRLLMPSRPALQQQMKDRVLQIRRPGGDVTRPYDAEVIPAVKAGVDVGKRLEYAVFEGTRPWLSNFNLLTPAKTGRTQGLDLSVRPRAAQCGLRFRGCLPAPADGEYTFHLTSDAGAQLRLHDALVIDDHFNHNGSEGTASARLQTGLHPLGLFCRHQTGGAALRLEDSRQRIPRQPVPATALRGPVDPPPGQSAP